MHIYVTHTRRPTYARIYVDCDFQVETIGDAYMVVSGAPMTEDNHAEKVCDMALDMVDAITDLKDPSTGKKIWVCQFVDALQKRSFLRIIHTHQ